MPLTSPTVQTQTEVRQNLSRPCEPILVARAVRKTYRTGAESVDALKGIDLAIESGQFVSVMGPSGSGKTTLLNCLSGGEFRGQPWQNGPLRPIFVPQKKTYQETDEIAWIIEKDRLFWPTLEFESGGQESQARERA